MTDYTNQDAYDIGVRLAQSNPGIEYDDLAIDPTHNREVYDLIQFIDEEDHDGLGVYLEDGFLDERRGKVRKVVH
jgi:hypothetical protein